MYKPANKTAVACIIDIKSFCNERWQWYMKNKTFTQSCKYLKIGNVIFNAIKTKVQINKYFG